MIGGAAVGGWSYKQKMVTRHSTESEIVGLTDGLSEVVWSKKWLEKSGYDQGPVDVWQDNEAVTKLIGSERRTHQRTKHIDARFFYAKELSEKKEIILRWTPNHLMIADLMTKPVMGSLFVSLEEYITGNKTWNITNEKYKTILT